MKKYYLPIALGIILLLVGFTIFSKNKSSREFKDLVDRYKEKEQIYKSNIDSITAVNAELTLLVAQKEEKAVEVEKAEEKAKELVKRWQYSYRQLAKQVPTNTKDSLGNYMQRDTILRSENSELNKALVLCDSAKTIYKSVNLDLKEIISNKDLIINNKDSIINGQSNIIEAVPQAIKSAVRSERKKMGIIGIILFLLGLAL